MLLIEDVQYVGYNMLLIEDVQYLYRYSSPYTHSLKVHLINCLLVKRQRMKSPVTVKLNILRINIRHSYNGSIVKSVVQKPTIKKD